ncbi:hypothetical protein [Pseudoalteromonas sp. NBT06-2]|uniref:hypothetical protein n=1 Tax=Pseudoalteromonas sp. NBT06-2 TaxID=2025950 RepID=UPI001140F2DD|nr:hypothetical protein [Pseudoalteromonas sp. NBT06-2]
MFLTPNVSAETVHKEPEIGQPIYQVTDNNNINNVSGTLYYQLTDVSIGTGALALSHSISVNSNDLANLDSYISGYKEKYRGGIRRIVHTNELSSTGKHFESIHVSDHEQSADFTVTSDGKFESMGDKRLQLIREDANHFAFIKPSGVKVLFYSQQSIPKTFSQNFSPYASMVRIEHPNGFAIDIHKSSSSIGAKITSVTSNNGLQLKYIYDVHSRPLESSKQSATNNPSVLADSLNWSNEFPSKIIALNNAIETCPITGNTCSTSHQWPQVEYVWPDGMPRALYVGQSTVTVKDAFGTITEFHHYAHDDQEGAQFPDYGKYFYPRIERVTNNKGLDISYEYENVWNPAYQLPHLWFTAGAKGILTKAVNNGVTTTYNFRNGGMAADNNWGSRVWTSGGYKNVQSVTRPANVFEYSQARVSSPYEIETWDKSIQLEATFANNVTQVESKLDGVVIDYRYDVYDRLIEKESDGLMSTVGYPYSYTGFCDNYSFCHKPASVSKWYRSGGSINTINYQYHPQSGNIKSITYPGNNQGIQRKVIYEYKEYYARYKNQSGTLTTSSEPIWLLDYEYECKGSAMSGVNCSGNDKVTTTYNYGSGSAANNLFLIGTTISTQGETDTRTTCFTYDSQGREIGVSSPRAQLDCNAIREY